MQEAWSLTCVFPSPCPPPSIPPVLASPLISWILPRPSDNTTMRSLTYYGHNWHSLRLQGQIYCVIKIKMKWNLIVTVLTTNKDGKKKITKWKQGRIGESRGGQYGQNEYSNIYYRIISQYSKLNGIIHLSGFTRMKDMHMLKDVSSHA